MTSLALAITHPKSTADVAALAAALASMPDDAVLSHRSAAQVWGIWIPEFAGIEITSPATASGSRYTTSVQRRDVIAHRRVLDPVDIVVVAGLRVTSLARTLLDLAAMLDPFDLVAAGDSALRLGCDRNDLAERVNPMKRARGLVRARHCLPVLNDRSASRPESRIRAALVFAGLPEPKVNMAIHDRYGQWIAEPDLHYDEAKVAIEYNGRDHENSMADDASKVLGYQRNGWEVRTYVARHAFRQLDDVVADVHALLRRRAPQLLTQVPLARRETYSQDQRRRKRRL